MDGCTAIILVNMSNWFCRRCLCCLIALRGTFTTKQQWWVRTALCAMAKLGWRQFWHALQKWLLSSHPDPLWVINVPHERKLNMLSCTEISSVISFFSFEKFWVKPGLPSTQLNLANTQNLEKINFDMFYKNYYWAVICYPICVTNVSYKREVIVLSFPVISFVILIFVFLRFDIESGFPFYWLTLYIYKQVLTLSIWETTILLP